MKLTVIALILFTLLVSTKQQSLHLQRVPYSQPPQSQSLNFQGSKNTKTHSLETSIIGFIIGPILFILSFIIIFNNERKAAIDYRRVQLAQSIVKEVNPYNEQQVKAAEGKLVHVTGDTVSDQKLLDHQSGICLEGVIKIQRNVEVRELRVYNNKSEAVWATTNQPTPGAGVTNDPAAWFINTYTHKAKNVRIGNYVLSQSLIDSLPCNQNYVPTLQNAYNLARRSQGRVKNQPKLEANYIYFPTDPATLDAPGTLRVKYSYCSIGQTSIISQSSKNTFVPFRIDIHENGKADDFDLQVQNNNKCCCCMLCDCTSGLLAPLRQVDLISQKKQTFAELLTSKKKQIGCKKHLIRILAYCLMVFSICAFFSPITNLIGFIPLVGGFISNALGLAIFVAAVVVCIPLFLLAVAVSWLFFHPKVGLILLGIGLLIAGAVAAGIYLRRGDTTAETAQSVQHLFYAMRSFT